MVLYNCGFTYYGALCSRLFHRLQPTQTAAYTQCGLHTLRPTHSLGPDHCGLCTLRPMHKAAYTGRPIQCIVQTIIIPYAVYSFKAIYVCVKHHPLNSTEWKRKNTWTFSSMPPGMVGLCLSPKSG